MLEISRKWNIKKNKQHKISLNETKQYILKELNILAMLNSINNRALKRNLILTPMKDV